jgi:chaperonin GroES
MPIDKAVNAAPSTSIEIETEDMPEIEVVLEDDGSATVEIGEDEGMDVDFYANLAELVDDDELSRISLQLQACYEADKASRQDWEEMYAKGMELLGIKMEERTKPFRGASGVTHPLLMEAIVQFQSQAMKELMPADGPVRTQVLGTETVEKAQQASRVQDFMNYQITTVMEEYTPEFDQMLFYLGYGGSAFKKVYFDRQLRRMVSKLVLADNLYIPYNGSSVMSQCNRITHVVSMPMTEFKKRVADGEYLDVGIQSSDYPPDSDQIQEAEDKQTGLSPGSEDDEVFLLEFMVDWDLLGFENLDEDGEPTEIACPYIITLDMVTGKVLAIRRNWKEGEEQKEKQNYYVHYMFVQGMGAYGLGLIHLIGNIAKGATSALRQLLDAGTLVNLPAGFKAKGARIADSDNPIQPGEWRDIDAGGAELSSSLMPLPYKEPSQTLFALLGFLVDAGRRLASIADMQVGEGNQMAAVGTTIALLEKGASVMSAIHQRMHYSQKLEFRLLAKGFGEYLPDEYPYDVPGASRKVKRSDFDNMVAILPVADPNIFSVAQRITLAQTQLQLAQSAPQMHNMYEAYYRVYAAMNVRDIDGILRPQRTQMPKDPAEENADVMDLMELKVFAGQQHDAHILSHLIMGMSPMLQSNPQAAITLQKHILHHVQMKAEEETAAELFQQYGSDPDGLVSDIQREGVIAIKVAQGMMEVRKIQSQLSGEGAGPDPIIQLKQAEIQQRAQADAAKNAVDEKRLLLEAEKMRQNRMANQERIQAQEDIAQLRAEVTRERFTQQPQGGNNAA